MIYNYIKNLSTIFLSFVFIYILADMIILPNLFYVSETVVPDVINQNISTGKIIIDDSELEYRVQFIPSESSDMIGTIINSIPVSGKKVKSGTIVDLKVLGEKETYIVPKLIDKSKNISINILKSMGIKLDTIFYDYWDVVCTDLTRIDEKFNIDKIFDLCIKPKENIVWRQYPESGKNVFKESAITLYVSKGDFAPEFYSIPTLIDLDLDVAIKKIKRAGLLLGEIEYVNSDLKISSNKVIDQYPFGECRITDKINLIVKK